MADLDTRAFKRLCEGVLPKLATFQAACDSETRRDAGRVLGIGGPAVGKAIAALESALREPLNGESLIDHSGPLHVVPNDAGELLRDFAADIRKRSAQFLSELEAMQYGSIVRLAMTRTSWLAYKEELETAYRKLRPDGIMDCGNEFYSRDRVWHEIEGSILNNHADFGIYSFPPSRKKKSARNGGLPGGLAMQMLAEEEIVLVMPGDSPSLPKGKVISQANLPREPVVHYRRSLEFDRTTTIEAYLGDRKIIGDNWLLGVDSISEIKDTLIRVGGMSFLPWPDVEHEHNNNTLRAYRLNPPMRPRIIWLAYRPQISRPAVKDFLKATATLKQKREFRT